MLGRVAADDVEHDEPWTGSPLAPRDIELLVECGVPRGAIRSDGTLDVGRLRELGWTVTSTALTPPDDQYHRDLARRHVERAMIDPDTRHGYR